MAANTVIDHMTRVYVALGANLNDPKRQLDDASRALALLAAPNSYLISPYYRSAPMAGSALVTDTAGMAQTEQPEYLNAVASFTTALAPLDLLDALQNIENQQGRVRLERWGPRSLDLDLLLYGDENISTPRLIVPHYGMKDRSFVLLPLLDIAPNLHLPCGTPICQLITDKMLSELQQLGIDH